MTNQRAGSRKFRTIWFDVLLLLTVGMFTNCYRLGEGPLAGTEGHRVETAMEMLRSGQWLVPRLFGEVYLQKPPLDYWVLAATEKLVGQANEFVWRLPSAVSAALLGVFLYGMGRRWYGRAAGLVSGLSFCGMVALWGQNRTAEIDALNTLGCVVCACLLIDLGYFSQRRRWAVMLGAAFGFWILMFTKGPAGLTVVVGALIGPAIFNRSWRALKSGWPWVALGLGLLPCIALFWAGRERIAEMHWAMDSTGIKGIGTRALLDFWPNFPWRFALPVEFVLYTLPLSYFFDLAFVAEIWGRRGDLPTEVGRPRLGTGEEGVWSDGDRRLLRALVGTLAASCAVTMVYGLVDFRYCYVWLPILCPVLGAIAAAWQRGVLPEKVHHRIVFRLGVTAIVLAAATWVISWMAMRQLLEWRPDSKAAVACGAAVVICVSTIRLLKAGRADAAGWGLVGLIVLLTLPYGQFSVNDRWMRSRRGVGIALQTDVEPGVTVWVGHMGRDHPEIFYYFGGKVLTLPEHGEKPMTFAEDRVLLLDVDEFHEWKGALGDRVESERVYVARSGPFELVRLRREQSNSGAVEQ